MPRASILTVDRTAKTIAVACVVTHLCVAGAAAESPAMSAWQEIVLLAMVKAQHAAASCGFRLDPGKADAMLASAALDANAPARQAVSPSLHRQITADADAYRGDREAACNEAWERFGSDGAPGLRGLLTR